MSHAISFELPSPDSFGGLLRGEIELPGDLADGPPRPTPTVVVCHGFKGFYEWGFFPPLSTLLAERGFVVVRFDYSGTGMRPGDDLVTDLDAFRRNTFSLELRETLHLLESCEQLAPGWIDPARIGLLGHSRGGGAAILAAGHERGRDRIRALVTWAAVATFDRYGREHRETWRRDGVLPIENGRTGQQLELGIELLDDVEQSAGSLDLEAAAARRGAPWLIVHGSDDETVPVSEARTLARAAAEAGNGASHQLVEIAGGSHTFGARHPFAGPTPALIQAMNATQTWFLRHLGRTAPG